MSKKKYNLIDLFAGAGGLSEGFIRQGFNPVAHVEMDEAACNTLLTRTAYHYLSSINKVDIYYSYLKEQIDRTELYDYLPNNLRESVINQPIGEANNNEIFDRIDSLKGCDSIDVIIGGPPCQAYSLVGRAKDINGMRGDSRNHLYIQYGEFLKKYKPKLFVFENVLGLLSAKSQDGEKYLDKMLTMFSEIGYNTEYRVLDASSFGVLQKRKRVILIGKRGETSDFYPDFKDKVVDAFVKEIFSGLPKLNTGDGNFYATDYTEGKSEYLKSTGIQNGIDFTTQHISRPHNDQDKEIYRIAVNKWNEKRERLNYNDLPEHLKTHKNRTSFIDRFKVVAEDLRSCHTIVAHISKDGHHYIHPDIKQNRSITPREAARLQSFPDDYFFEGVANKSNRTAAFKQIGNAVPPLMAEEIAKEINNILK